MALPNRTCFWVNLRDALQCRACGRRPEGAENYHRGFEYHHLQPKSQGGSDSPENLAVVCRQCHQSFHGANVAPNVTVGPLPEVFACAVCHGALDPTQVAMNCGWYHCHHCQETTHLFRHFYG
jgi:hypothetical protein